jgi:hypothetical protein
MKDDTTSYTRVADQCGDYSCPTCGGKRVLIRGRHPKDDKRIVCPTCLQERLDEIFEVPVRLEEDQAVKLGRKRGR